MARFLFPLFLVLVLALPAFGQSADEKTLLKLENDWVTAFQTQNAKLLDGILAPDYTATGSSGMTHAKTDEMKDVADPKYKKMTAKLSDMKVRLIGDVGIVFGLNTVTMPASGKDKAKTETYRFTDVFAKKNGKWQCVASHASIVAKKK